MNSSQMAAVAPEHEDPNVGWYNRFARHPYYGKLGKSLLKLVKRVCCTVRLKLNTYRHISLLRVTCKKIIPCRFLPLRVFNIRSRIRY